MSKYIVKEKLLNELKNINEFYNSEMNKFLENTTTYQNYKKKRKVIINLYEKIINGEFDYKEKNDKDHDLCQRISTIILEKETIDFDYINNAYIVRKNFYEKEKELQAIRYISLATIYYYDQGYLFTQELEKVLKSYKISHLGYKALIDDYYKNLRKERVK